jgi:large subunit ribosomal protein L21
MFAIVEIAGQQFKVAKDQKVFVHRLAAEEGASVSFDNVLMLSEGDKVTVGAPAIDGAQVGAKIIKHLKGDKVIVFKKKRRKGYRVKNGHRQSLTEIVIESIVVSGAKKAAPEKEAKPSALKVEKPAAKKEESASNDVSSHTVAELKAMAKEKGVTGYTSMKKAELIAALS